MSRHMHAGGNDSSHITSPHVPVLYEEVIETLAIKPEGIYIDGTFGRGGHSQAILNQLGPNGRLIAFDKDPEALVFAKQQLNDSRFNIVQGSYTQLEATIIQQGLADRVSGILLDLGVSSPQLDNPERGFSFLRKGPLDMRMDPGQGLSAAEWLQVASDREIAEVLREYGEERFAKRIAAAIIKERQQQPLTSTTQLANVIAAAHPAWEKGKHPATQSFQAIRIFLNQELAELTDVLEQALRVLAIGGRLAVISFHSLEDRIVKRFMRTHIRGDDFPRDLPIKQVQLTARLCNIGQAIKPKAAEIQRNPRARSAVLRVVEKIK
jgi:16S rRNA (cytosine1402-N4)-methyltransferase